MHARIATFEADPARADEAIAAARQQVESNWANPPEGLERAKEMYMLIDREHGRASGSRCTKRRTTCDVATRRLIR